MQVANASLVASRTILQELLTCLNFILLVQMKKVISMNYTAAQAAENHRDDWGLT